MLLEPSRVEIFTGSSFQDAKLKNQAHCHPFTEQERRTPLSDSFFSSFVNLTFFSFEKQLDLIFPSDPTFENALEAAIIKAPPPPRYVKARVLLSRVVKESASWISHASKSRISMLSCGSGPKFSTQEEEDVWCIDHRGVLTLSVCKDTYDGLGLVGTRVAFGKGKAKRGDGRHVISIPLYAPDAESGKIRAQREAALERWEERRAKRVGGGASLWNVLVLVTSSSEGTAAKDLEDIVKNLAQDAMEPVPVRYQKNVSKDVQIPDVRLTRSPRARRGLDRSSEAKQEEEEEEEWGEKMHGLFEWVGLAGLGATRLKANDRVDPFVAVYDAPSPTRVGNVTWMRWSGFIGPSFVHSLIELLSRLLGQSPATDSPAFASLVGHACSWSPVSYISATKAQLGAAVDVAPPVRDPTREVEDSWCLILSSAAAAAAKDPANVAEGGEGGEGGDDVCMWVLAESVGKHDTRFG